jgi:hypothetical protein
MDKIDFVLLSDGSSDRCLIPILKWLLRRHFVDIPINGEWADVSRSLQSRNTLASRIRLAVELYQPNILFVHRDAEAQDPQLRYDEVGGAISRIGSSIPIQAYVCVVPVRMTEAWLLFDMQALKIAAGNPNCRTSIQLPPLSSVESLSDPKQMLAEILVQASELHGRHLKRFKPNRCRHLISENIEDFSPLFDLQAFQRLNRDIMNLVDSIG